MNQTDKKDRKARRIAGTFGFIDDLTAIKDYSESMCSFSEINYFEL